MSHPSPATVTVSGLSLTLSITQGQEGLTGPELTGPELTGPELTGPELTGALVDGLGSGGRYPDLPDHRDVGWDTEPALAEADEAQGAVDLRTDDVPVLDQGRLPACTSHAVSSAVQYLQRGLGADGPTPSRTFQYWNERFGPVHNPAVGVSLRTGLKALNAYGICPAELWPYRAGLVDRNPPLLAYQQARYAGDVRYVRLPVQGGDPEAALLPVRRSLAAGRPVLFGLSVYDNLRRVPASGRVPRPRAGARLLFGHAALVVGSSPADGTFTCQNSWGRDWGAEGFFTLEADYLADPSLAQDFWVITSIGD